ncbi:phosphate/phosphite/phosphonate ABC transporter substrate-binding protein [Actinokineospora auranticolor]|uniref:Phosphonate transport system substrate-binding protein n=1 Tax=Actinokineospora auranticolor TaxID=155976 RepID=A0A2S6GKL5_9PSEU|nr:phosphate/phosphite/phosphonate ABC transporter substrate-binding protein [Actinokineospora auranticolor]PPK65745.1 phosphonate transport system substrate-binding protein [Actinokineospora auranticolor]
MKRIVALAVAAGLALTACGSEEPAKPAAASSACPNGEVKFGIEPYEDPAKLTPAYQVLTGALERGLNCEVKLQIVQDYSAEVLAMQNGKLELAQFGPLGFVFANRRAGAEPLVSFGDAQGKLTSYQAGIWVPADSAVKSIADLRGKTLALSEPGSTSGDALPRAAMAKLGLDKTSVKLDYAGGHPEALLALTNGKVEAAEINTQQLATAKAAGKFDESKFRQIWSSDPIPNDPITVAGAADPAFKEAVRKALLNLKPDEVAQVGKLLDVDPAGPMVAVDKNTYQPLFDLADTLGLTEGDV